MKGRYMFRADLQVHLFLNANYGLYEVLKTMERKNLDAIAVLPYQWNKKTTLLLTGQNDQRLKQEYKQEVGEEFLCFINKEGQNLFLIFGEEVAAANQKWHFLSIGALDIESSLKGSAEEIIEEVLSKDGLLIWDHPFADPKRRWKDIDPQKERELYRICQRYRGRIAVEWNGYCIPWIRFLLPGCGNVNKMIETAGYDFNIPIIPTTDLHAKNKRLLKAMGTNFIEIPTKDIALDNPFGSLKKNVLSGNFASQKKHVSFWHFAEAFGVPVLKDIMAGR